MKGKNKTKRQATADAVPLERPTENFEWERILKFYRRRKSKDAGTLAEAAEAAEAARISVGKPKTLADVNKANAEFWGKARWDTVMY